MLIDQPEDGPASSAAANEASGSAGGATQNPLYSLPIDECVYRGEGNSNLVVALPSEGKVIRLRKFPGGGAEDDTSPGEKECRERKEEAEAMARVLRGVDFVRAVISGFLGRYACAPEILRLGQADIARLSEKIRAERPGERLHKSILGTCATMYPDCTLLPEGLRRLSDKPTFCVEIKPKQGFLTRSDREFKKCPYCLMQYYKARKGGVERPSAYCPLDLFSGSAERLDRALAGLLSSPQNNLRIFEDGELVYGGGGRRRRAEPESEGPRSLLARWLRVGGDEARLEEAFRRLIRTALTRPFEDVDESAVGGGTAAESAELRAENARAPCRLRPGLVERAKRLLRLADLEECRPGEGAERPAAVGSVLERILRMQRLHRCGADVVAWIRARLAGALGDELTCGELEALVDDDARAAAALPTEIVLDPCGMKKSQDIESEEEMDIKEKNSDFSKQKEQYKNHPNQCDRDLPNSVFNLNDCLAILKNYLLFCTARDCSILMAFQEVDKDSSRSVESKDLIDVFDDQSFLVSTRVIDLDTKILQCIEKHVCRDNEILEATIFELEKKLRL